MLNLIQKLKSVPLRDLPWRRTRNPYRILVSEIMLQQTQVERVVPFYRAFVREFPTARLLAAAPLSDVLRVWNGLGYNRRARYLHLAGKHIAEKRFPKTPEEMEQLPGVGHYTARAVAAFAFNSPEVFIETNIRTVFLHHFFAAQEKVADIALLPLVGEALRKSKMEPWEFYARLMDYGALLKKSGVKNNAQSKHYAKQSKFEGSVRQRRAAELRRALARGAEEKELERLLRAK